MGIVILIVAVCVCMWPVLSRQSNNTWKGPEKGFDEQVGTGKAGGIVLVVMLLLYFVGR
jgi:hypothetical protein